MINAIWIACTNDFYNNISRVLRSEEKLIALETDISNQITLTQVWGNYGSFILA